MTTRTARTNRRRVPLAVATGTALLALAACGGDDSGSGGGDFSVERALGDLPASALGDHYVLTVGDLDGATEAAGIERPEPGADIDELREWILPITGVGTDEAPADVYILPPESANVASFTEIEAFHDEVGWSLDEVSWYAEVSAPPARFTVLHGDIDPADIDEALGERDDDVWSIGGDDFEVDVAATSAARPLGEALRLAEDGGVLAVSKSTPPIEDWLAGDDRLDDDDDLVAVAEALDEHDVYTAMLLDGDDLEFGPGVQITDEQLEAIDAEPLEPFDTFGAGLTIVDDEPVAVLVYHHATSATAEENAELLEELLDGDSVVTGQPLAEVFELADVNVDGQVLTATVEFGDDGLPGHLWRGIQAREIFVSHR